MYTDPFDFISTRTDLKTPIEDASLSIRLTPYVPADINVSLPQGTANKQVSLLETVANRLNNIPSNNPAYTYTTKQEKRYNNPYLQFTPTNLYGTDSEDIYGRFQGSGERFLNSFLKTGANFWGTYVSTFLSMPKRIDAWRTGETFNKDGKFEWIQNQLTALEDKLPNYYTQSERDRSDWINAVPFSGGAMNFWGDKVIKNIGFSMGALTAGLTADALLTVATGGTSSPATTVSAINRIRSLSPELFSMIRQVAKGADKTDDIIAAAQLTKNFSKGLEISALSKITTASRYAAINYFTAQGEAFVEGYHTWLDTKKQLLEDAIYRNETDPETLQEINERAEKAGKYTTALNLPVILASNLLQFPNLIMGRGVVKGVESLVKTQATKEGLKAVSTFSTKEALKKIGKETLKDVFSEGLEEGLQYHIGKSVHDYYANRVNPKTKSDLLSYLMENLPETLTDDEFWQNVGIGSLTGFLMGAPASIPLLTKGRTRSESAANYLENSYKRFNSTVKQYQSSIDLNNPDSVNNIAAHDALYSSVHDNLQLGSYKSFLSSLNDLKEIDLKSFNEGFGKQFTSELERDAFVNQLIEDAENVKADIEKVNFYYKDNPYTTNPFLKRIREAFSTAKESQINSIEENLFNDFKEVVARNESLLRHTKGKILNNQQNLKSLGIKDNSIEYLGNLTRSKRGFKNYLDFKHAQLKDLVRQVKYYEELSNAVTDQSEIDPKLQLRQAKQQVEKTTEYYDKLLSYYNSLEKLSKEQEEELLELVINEEVSEEQFDRFKKEKIKEEIKDLNLNEEIKERTESEKPEDIQEQILKVNEEAEENKEPYVEQFPTVPNINPLSKFEIGKDVIIDGRKFTVKSLLENEATVEDNRGNIYQVDQNGEIVKSTPEAQLLAPVEEYFSPDVQLEKPQPKPVYQLGQETFSKDEIKNYPNTHWIEPQNFVAEADVYSIFEDGFQKTRIIKTEGGLTLGDLKKLKTPFNKLPNKQFKQVFTEGEPIVTKQTTEPVIDEMDQKIKSFLKKNTSLLPLFRDQINKNKFKLEC